MMSKVFYGIIFFAFLFSTSFAQNIEISSELKKGIDKDLQEQLFPALDSLVAQIRRNKVSDELLWEKENEFTKSTFEDINYYETAYRDSSNTISISLINCYPIGGGRFLNKLAYVDENENQSESIKMLISVIANMKQGKITFSTPLNYYTQTWKEQKVGSITYYFRDKFRVDRAEKFAQKNVLFASRFRKRPQSLKFFMVENYQEILRLMGLDYNASTIGKLRDGYGVIADEIIFSVMNNEDFSHDLFHYYSGTVHDRPKRNWVTEEGLAYSWGNAYYTRKDGEMAEQEELLNTLKLYLQQNKEKDLLQLFENNFWSDKSGVYDHLAPDFKVGRLISSLICDEVQKKHGMEGINQLITCGSKPNHFDPFFKTTDKLIGLNKSNFDKTVRRLIKNY